MQVAPPGAAWSYNNAGFSIAGRVIEVVTGTPINRAMRDLVFQPLGLEHAGTTAGEFIVQRFASGHATREGKTTLQRPFSAVDERDRRRRGSVHDRSARLRRASTWATAPRRRESACSSASRWSRCAPRSCASRVPTTTSGSAWHMRQVGPIRTFGHGGTLGGHILLLEIVPERNFAIAMLTNANTGWRLIQDVEREALKSYLGAAYARNQAIAHRGLVETLPSVRAARAPARSGALRRLIRAAEQFIRRARRGRKAVRAGSPERRRHAP